jgi:hypothetical protein
MMVIDPSSEWHINNQTKRILLKQQSKKDMEEIDFPKLYNVVGAK